MTLREVHFCQVHFADGQISKLIAFSTKMRCDRAFARQLQHVH